MTDHVVVKGLRVPVRVGVTPEERARPQVVVVDLDVTTDLSAAGSSDDLEDTIDYAALVSSVDTLLREDEANLLEALAQRIVEEVAEIKEATGVTVEVSKEIVPITEKVDGVTVRIERQFT
jgi:dihydroneopterin aldolase/2-amino-4-hydroxy-6-hydroxymethyldihydropteridine diphosphokinase